MKWSFAGLFVTAEEQGVKGSEYYVAHPFMPNAKTKAMLNLESVGRGERINVGSGKNYPQIWEVLDRLNGQYVRFAVRLPEQNQRAHGSGGRTTQFSHHACGNYSHFFLRKSVQLIN